jgi:hypothetical protein
MTSRAILILLAIVATSDVASAQSLRRGACGADIQSFCGKPARGELRKCLADNRAKLSAACKVAIADRWLERAAKRGAKPGGEATDAD